MTTGAARYLLSVYSCESSERCSLPENHYGQRSQWRLDARHHVSPRFVGPAVRQVRVLSLRIMIVTTIVISVITTVTVIATVIRHYGHRHHCHHHHCQHQPSAGRRGPERSSSRGFESCRTTSSVNTAHRRAPQSALPAPRRGDGDRLTARERTRRIRGEGPGGDPRGHCERRTAPSPAPPPSRCFAAADPARFLPGPGPAPSAPSPFGTPPVLGAQGACCGLVSLWSPGVSWGAQQMRPRSHGLPVRRTTPRQSPHLEKPLPPRGLNTAWRGGVQVSGSPPSTPWHFPSSC